MLDLTIIRLYLTDIIFLTINILLLHILLTSRRPFWFQGIVFFASHHTRNLGFSGAFVGNGSIAINKKIFSASY